MWSSFLKNSWKIFKNEDFGCKIVKKGQILMRFSGLAPSKLKIFINKIKGYVFIWIMDQEIAHGRKG